MKKILMYVNGFLLLNLIWYTAFLIFNREIIPNPIDVYRAYTLFFNEKMYIHIFVSFGRIIAGILISLFLGSIIGSAMATNIRLNKYLNPLIFFTNPILKSALLPITIIIGLGDASKIILITLIFSFQIIASVRDSVHAIDRECVEYIFSLGASKKQIFNHVIIPKIIPEIIISVRTTLGTALTILFFVEGYGTSCGIGYYVWNAWSRTDYLSTYKGIIIISIVGVVLYLFIDLIEKKMVKWR